MAISQSLANRADQQAAAAEPVRRPPSADAILSAAKALFLEGGYDGVNLERIAERAAVSRQTLYNQFGSKEAIFRTMIERHWAIFSDERLFLMPDHGAPADPASLLRGLAQTILRFIRENDQVAFTRLVISESRRLPWIAETFYRLGKQPLLAAFSRSLEQMTSAGLLHCPDTTLAAHQFFGLVQEFVFWPHVMSIGPDVAKLPTADLAIDQAVETFLCRFGKPADQRPSARTSRQPPSSSGRQARAAGTVSTTR